VHVSPNSVRDVTEELGQTLLAHQQQAVADAMDGTEPPDVTTPVPERLYITMDGVLAHLHERGWSELKVGCCYQTHSRGERKRPEHLDIRAHSLSYISSLAEAQDFGYQLWQEAARRGVREAKEVVVLGDGAHWIWNIADTQFSGATQIVDWYHASSYVWKAASAIWGEVHPQREVWAHRHLEMLWEGKVKQVVEELEQQQGSGDGVRAAVIYFLEHGKRMDYPTYRARGLQIGSGSVESACKQLVSARLKQAGMIWDAAGAEAVAMVRAWLKSERWQEAMALRAVPRRSYERQQARVRTEESSLAEAGPRGRLEPDVLARVRAEMAQEGSPHPWRKAWSVRRQREQSLEQMQTATTTLAA
jgi:hypothetical protein